MSELAISLGLFAVTLAVAWVVRQVHELKRDREDDAETIDVLMKDLMRHEERLGSLERSEGRDESLNGTMWD